MPEVHVYMVEGRTPEQKKSFMTALHEAVMTHLGSPAHAISVHLIEAPATDKMVGEQTYAERGKPAK